MIRRIQKLQRLWRCDGNASSISAFFPCPNWVNDIPVCKSGPASQPTTVSHCTKYHHLIFHFFCNYEQGVLREIWTKLFMSVSCLASGEQETLLILAHYA